MVQKGTKMLNFTFGARFRQSYMLRGMGTATVKPKTRGRILPKIVVLLHV